MSKGKLVRWAGLAVLISSAALAGCGPSVEDQVATAVALTAAAATSTPTVTPTPTITPTFTPTLTSTVTPTPTPLPFGRTVNPPVFTGNGHFYEAVTVSGGISWFDAKVAAESRTFEGIQGHLATINSAQENRFIVGNFPDAEGTRVDGGDRKAGYWLGGFQPANSSEPNSDWQWVTGEPFFYTNWSPGEPNQFRGRQEDCLHPAGDGNSTWNDELCERLWAGYFVEYNPSRPSATLDPLTEYGAALLPLVLPSWEEGMTQVGVLSAAASENVDLMSDADWRFNMVIAFVSVELANAALREVDVPEEALEVHSVLLDAAFELDLMIELMSAAADELDTDKIIAATEAMARAAEHIDRANDMLP